MEINSVKIRISNAKINVSADCILPLPRFRFFNPLIFSSEGNLKKTDNLDEHSLKITVKTNEKVTLSCAPNYFKKLSLNNSKTLTAKCKSDEVFGMFLFVFNQER